jgi:hypothetical protein
MFISTFADINGFAVASVAVLKLQDQRLSFLGSVERVLTLGSQLQSA